LSDITITSSAVGWRINCSQRTLPRTRCGVVGAAVDLGWTNR